MIYASMVGELYIALDRGRWLLERCPNPNSFPEVVERIVREDRDLRDKYVVSSVTWDFNGGGGFRVRVVCRRKSCDSAVEVSLDV